MANKKTANKEATNKRELNTRGIVGGGMGADLLKLRMGRPRRGRGVLKLRTFIYIFEHIILFNYAIALLCIHLVYAIVGAIMFIYYAFDFYSW